MVEERESIGTGVWRKAIRLHLNTENYHAAVRINRNSMIIAIYDMDGRVYDMTRWEITSEDGAYTTFHLLIKRFRNVLDNSKVPIMSIGVAVPGPSITRPAESL